jgi:hypothetical protein
MRKRVLDILRLYGIKDFQSEPHHQHQNFAERKIGDTKRLTDAIMDRTRTQASFWLLCLLCVVFLLNQLASDALGGLTPIEVATGQRPDISALLQFHWFEPVFYSVDYSFASDSPEKSGRCVGIAETACSRPRWITPLPECVIFLALPNFNPISQILVVSRNRTESFS